MLVGKSGEMIRYIEELYECEIDTSVEGNITTLSNINTLGNINAPTNQIT